MEQTALAAGSLRDEPAVVELRAPLLIEQVQRLSALDRQVWLDLGSVKRGLVGRLAAGPHCLIVADNGRDRGEADAIGALDLSVLDGGFGREGLDLVLSWDLLNYMETGALSALAEQLERHAAPDCALHALIRYSKPLMPDRPEPFTMTPDATLVAPTGAPAARPAPRPSPKALEKTMPGWKVERTMLLNNGMQEFLFRKRKASAA